MGKPEIRFKGYTDEWEQRKLKEIADKVSEKNKNNEFSEPFTNSAEQGIISQKDYFDREIVNNENLDGYYIVRNDDFIYNPRISATAPVGPINRNRLGRNGVMSPLYTVFRTHDIDNLYLEFYFKTTKWHRFMKLNGDSGARFDRFTISSTQFMEMPIPYPTLEEQQKIGKYFDSLDHLITLQQRKCDEVKSLKKYMLQKMFPQNEQKVPEIRFEGFTEAWEQRKLGDVLDDMYNGQTPSRNKSEYWNGNIKWLSSGELNRGTVYDSMEMITEDGQKSANLRIVPKGTFIMAITGLEAAGTRGNCALLGFDTTLNQSCMALFPKKDLLTSDFLFQWYRKVGEEYGINYTQGTKQQSYNAELIKILPISLPSVAEQRKIASYLSNLDHFITLHQQKCEELKKIKKFMLQKMFV